MTNEIAIETFYKAVISDMAKDHPKVPVDGFRIEGNDLYAPDWFKYMLYGRGPGKFPPPDRILKWVQSNPDLLASAQAVYKNITEKGLAYLIGRKIANFGTDVWQGKRKGVDLLGAMDRRLPKLKEDLGKSKLEEITTTLSQAIRK